MTDPTHKAVTEPGTSADHAGQTLITRDHEVIRRWAESRDATPIGNADGTTVAPPGTLGLALPGDPGGDGLSWEQWFESFDRHDLRFAYRETEADGTASTFWAIDASGNEEG
ncbi:hypothetical protein [Jiangella anatolica]|uniref:Uncharacterized protein n=1 Tax=Jiangella anatolica TaxID=2670374 RepID=A0A2W2CJA5_9ACTN|nr:hypothetical protein [Jiangella anatolica]PZF80313.1 hypothetical protein C1I92_26875 [Jiangella anatolica]